MSKSNVHPNAYRVKVEFPPVSPIPVVHIDAPLPGTTKPTFIKRKINVRDVSGELEKIAALDGELARIAGELIEQNSHAERFIVRAAWMVADGLVTDPEPSPYNPPSRQNLIARVRSQTNPSKQYGVHLDKLSPFPDMSDRFSHSIR